AEDNAPIPAATVAVWSQADSALVAGAIVQRDGSFRIEGLRPGTYYLKVTMLGYAPLATAPVALTLAAPRASLGQIRLARAVIELEGVEVTAERAVIIAPDRNSYRVKDVAPGATSASDVLENVPAVHVDADGKVSLRGNENVVVQINGRPTPVRGPQLAGYLKQLPANTIERVEVIPNPSARQDPEGMAGIINIVMKQGVDLGTSAGLTLAGSTADRYFAGGNLGHQRGPVALFLSYGYNSDERQITGVNDRTRLGALRAPLSFTEQDIDGTAGNHGHNLSLNLDYQWSKRDVLSSTLQLNRRGASDGAYMDYTELSGGRELVDRYGRVRDVENANRLADFLLSFKRTYTPQRHELAAELRLNRQDDEERSTLWRQAVAGPGGSPPVSRTDAENNDVDAVTDQLTAQLDYTRPLGPRTKLETGYKGNARWLDRDYRVEKDPLGTGQFTRSELSNALELDERVNAGYAVLSHGLGRAELQAGLRTEYASRDFRLADLGRTFPHSYRSLFPSGLVSYKLNDKSQLKLSYSRRIRRPGAQELNPFPVYFDVQNVFFGNPRLDPEYTDAVELAYQRSGQLGTLQVSPFYRRTTDIIRVDINTADTLNGREITSISFRNLDHSASWGADVNGQFKLGRTFSGLAGFNVFKMVTDGGSESTLSSDAVTWMARVNGTLNLNPTTALIVNYFYRAPMNFERGRFSRIANANVSVRRKLYGDRATLTLRASDPFNTARFSARVSDDRTIQFTERGFNTRALHLTFQYNYGQAPRLRQRRQEEVEP
ncbi:MAG: TonB-dependent receptor, partial [Gemmatimonadetes bacterium]|nr:TonB-dependent receptor [Gemmatimonadota bacterium]